MYRREPISKSTRFEVFKRDEFTCQYCGAHPPLVVLEIDHITPVASGGGSEIENLVTSCMDCNRGKGAVHLEQRPAALAITAEQVAEREAQIAGYAAVMEARRERLEAEVWRVIEELEPGAESYDRRRFATIKTFVDRLGVHHTLRAVEIASSRIRSRWQTYKYFCGICWRCIRENRTPDDEPR